MKSHMAGMANVDQDCRDIFMTAFEDRLGEMCNMPWWTTYLKFITQYYSCSIQHI